MSLAAENAVQKELQEYLGEKGINTLFIKIVEQLLLEKPESPVEFIVQYLFENFPRETAGFREDKDTRPALRVSADSSSLKADSGESDENDKDQIPFELHTPKSSPRPSSRRRFSVSAPIINFRDSRSKWGSVSFPKTDEEAAMLTAYLSSATLFQHLSDEEKQTLVHAFEKFRVPENRDIICQGDSVASHFFVLGKGTAKALKDGAQVAEYSAPDSFGELALMHHAPRAATIRSCEPCVLWRLDQRTFRVILMGAAANRRDKYTKILEKVPVLKEMSSKERAVLVDALQEREYKRSDTIVKQGEAGSEFFIIVAGEVQVYRDSNLISTLSEGDYFGEIALLTSKTRQASILASSDTVKVVTVERKAFQRVLGPLSDILARNMRAYSTWAIS